MSEVKEYIQLYYVYECRVDGILRYVGMGKGSRYKHCNSGKSSCSELNRDFHEGKEIVVTKVKEKMTKYDALMYEWERIMESEGLYNLKKDLSFGQIPDFKRSTQYKVLGTYFDKKTRPKFLKFLGNKADEMTQESFDKLRKVLSECGLEAVMVQYDGASPIMILDRTEVSDEELSHLGCPNWPNCSVVGGCGRNL